MPAPIDWTGHIFGKLTVLAIGEPVKVNKGRWNLRRWRCRCECGNEVVVRTTHLTNGNTRSCGCLQRQKASISGKARSDHREPGVCPYCGKDIARRMNQRFCGRECKEAYELADRANMQCSFCGQPLKDTGMGRRPDYCSSACKRRMQSLRETNLEALTINEQLSRRVDE